VAGLGTYVTLSTQNVTEFDAHKYLPAGVDPAVANLVNALLQGHQIGGLVPIAPELRARGMAQGQGDNRFGFNFGGGAEFRISSRLSIGFDYRANKMEGAHAAVSDVRFQTGYPLLMLVRQLTSTSYSLEQIGTESSRLARAGGSKYV